MNICRQVVLGLTMIGLAALDARAEAKLFHVEAQNIELEVPAGWGKTAKGADMTMLAPKSFKGRAIQILALKAMPEAKAEAIGKLLGGGDKVEITRVGQVEREGVKIVVAEGKATLPKGTMSIDLLVIPTRAGGTALVSYMKGDQDPVLREANTKILLSARESGPRVTVTVTPPKAPGIVGAPAKFIEAFQTGIAPLIDKKFRFPRPLAIKFEDCGTVNAFYSPKDHSIRMCHEIFDALVKTFVDAGSDPDKAMLLTRGTLTFVFFHELGHALVGELGLPITGRGEDAADELATLVLSGIEAGRKASLDAARWFDIESKKGKKLKFWDDHSMDGQRVITILCLLYGADKPRYEPILTKLGVNAGRLSKCARDYPLRNRTWGQMLAPHRRKDPLPA